MNQKNNLCRTEWVLGERHSLRIKAIRFSYFWLVCNLKTTYDNADLTTVFTKAIEAKYPNSHLLGVFHPPYLATWIVHIENEEFDEIDPMTMIEFEDIEDAKEENING